ncbi:hypothetical protein KP509_39G034700 [Ceratopteris richardii]|uniref:Uncharacterized protein n=1 Tax=Ceratopteris richardii TaxID=49495 RepID=A0A8T2Q0F0_CERRI|nr:hypothetical protein KP509_39G034700 [Ceratopteris richardii]
MDANLPVHQTFNVVFNVVGNDFHIIDTGNMQPSSYINDRLLQISTTLFQVSVTLLISHLIRPIAAIILVLASISLAALTLQSFLLRRHEVHSLPYHATASDAPARWQRMASRIDRPLHICAFVCLLLLTAFALLI